MAGQRTVSVQAARPKPSAKPLRARARVTPVSTTRSTVQRLIVYGCPYCGMSHRVIELGVRQSACRRGLVLVAVGGA